MFPPFALFMVLHMFICLSGLFALFLIVLWFIKFATAKQVRRWAFFFVLLAITGMIIMHFTVPGTIEKPFVGSGYMMRGYTGSGDLFMMHHKRFN